MSETTPRDRLIAALQAKGSRTNDGGKTWTCPAHDDNKPSLSVGTGTDGRALFHCQAFCDSEVVLAASGLQWSDLFVDRPSNDQTIIATFDYVDAGGTMLFQVVRSWPKDFTQRRPNGNGGWIWNTKGVPRVLYRLPQVLLAVKKNRTIYVVEGERDVHSIERVGGVATCNPMGAGAWRPEYSKSLRDADVLIVTDRDDSGIKHAQQVEQALRNVAASVSILEPVVGKDVTDHLASGRGLDELLPFGVRIEDPPQAAEPQSSWMPVDLAAVADGSAATEPPNMLARTDGELLLYPRKRHLLAGEPESGKGWIVMLAGADQIQAGRRVLYLDFEDSPETALERLQALGVSLPDILEHFVYVRPDSPLDIDLGELGRDAVLAVVDGMTECMNLLGLNPYDNPDVASFFATITRPLTEVGAAVLILDHVVKDRDNRGRWAIGAQHKMAGSDVCFSLETIRPFGRGLTGGLSRLTLTKDRPGFLRQHAVGRTRLGDVHMDSDGDSVQVRIDPAQEAGESGFRPTVLMERVSRFLELQNEPCSQATIRSTVSGQDAGKIRALAVLVSEGYVAVEAGPRNALLHRSIRAFREEEQVDGV